MSKLFSLRERKIKDRPRISKWTWTLIAIAVLTIEIFSLRQFGPIITALFHAVIAAYITSRAWFVREWKVSVHSGRWTPIPVEEAVSDNVVKKRAAKSFKIV